jgi:hypothetical protein
MVGKIIFSQGPNVLEASLDEEIHWHCRDTGLEFFLNQSIRWGAGCGMDDTAGMQVLYQAAAVLNGQVVCL